MLPPPPPPPRAHLPCEAIGLAPLVSEVGHLAVLDVHPRLPLVLLGLPRAVRRLVVDHLGDDADERPAVVLVLVHGIFGIVPPEHLIFVFGC